MTSVGTSPPRLDAPRKLSGAARYVDDHPLPGCLRGVTLRSSAAHARIKGILFDPGFPWADYVVAAARDVPGENVVAFLDTDQPLLAAGIVRHKMEPLLLVAHPSLPAAYEALRHITVEYEELPAVHSIEDSLGLGVVLREPDNCFKDILIEKGDIEEGFRSAALVAEQEYRTPWQEQAYIETNGMAAWVEPDGTLSLLGSLQCPYFAHKALLRMFKLAPEKIRVAQAETGGAFGGKEEFPSVLAGHAALLAWKAKRPVKMIYDRAEDMAATTKRHPARIRHRTAVSRDGRLLAQDIEVVFDGGAYMTISPVVLSRGAIHAGGPYACPNVRIRARAVATNSPPNGAFRGFGVPQTMYAAELHMERLASALGMDPAELRRRNLLREGSSNATGQVFRGGVAAADCLDKVLRMSRYCAKRRAYARLNRKPGARAWRGVGLAMAYHGAGFTGSGEVYLKSRAGVAIGRDGAFRVLAASTEMGQGATTVFAQIAADAFGVPLSWVAVERADTGRVPDSGPTVASRTTMIVGRLVERASLRLKEAFVQASGGVPRSRAAFKRAAGLVCGDQPGREFIVEYEKPPEVQWDEKLYRGDAYGAFAFCGLVVDLEVDKLTYEVRLRKVHAAAEAGKAIHPCLLKGQLMGGFAQGLGYALWENAVFRDGVMANAQMTDYVVPTAADLPDFDIAVLEKPYGRGPFGAKGVGELPADIPAPAVAAAVLNATGLFIPSIPVLPEKICAGLTYAAANSPTHGEFAAASASPGPGRAGWGS